MVVQDTVAPLSTARACSISSGVNVPLNIALRKEISAIVVLASLQRGSVEWCGGARMETSPQIGNGDVLCTHSAQGAHVHWTVGLGQASLQLVHQLS